MTCSNCGVEVTPYVWHSCWDANPVPGPLAIPPAAQQSIWLSDAAERRRYALGQMAAQLRSACGSTGNSSFINASSLWSREAAVNEAMELLAIIERREKEGK